MRKIQRRAVVGALAGLTIFATACGEDEQPAPPAPAPQTTQTSPATSSPAGGGGVTTPEDTFGPACDELPQGNEPGSLNAMGPQPVATAASTNPQLTTLVQAIGRVPGLADTLNSQPALTVFAPTDDAFTALEVQLGPEQYQALLNNPQQLGAVLGYHVSQTRYDRDGLVQAGTVQTMGGTVQIAKAGDSITVNGANVLCGNIPTANATVFLIDQVLMPPI